MPSDPPINLPPITPQLPSMQPGIESNPKYQDHPFGQMRYASNNGPAQVTLPGVSSLSQHLPISGNLPSRNSGLPGMSDPNNNPASAGYALRPPGQTLPSHATSLPMGDTKSPVVTLPAPTPPQQYPTQSAVSASSHHLSGPNIAPQRPQGKEFKKKEQVSPPASSQQPRQLNVKDALSYLELVKHQFSSQPEVYHRFLEIMKDFKNQIIDTPQVIERVSTLFRSQPSLIVGFNTFLPPGYSLEPTNDPDDPVKVKMPFDSVYKVKNTSEAPYPSRSFQGQHGDAENSFGSAPSAQPHSAQVTGASNIITSMNDKKTDSSGKQRVPVEFDHAIAYVNKIKARFINKPETYRTFLEILQSYQKEEKPIAEVHAQVQYLFNGAPDLLEEFKQFLPDNSNAGVAATEASQVPSKKPLRRANLPQPAAYYPQPTVVQPLPPKKKAKTGKPEKLTTAEELDFFDRCKRVIGNKSTYNEFLKILNLFTQEIIEAKVLIERVEPFLGKAPELFDWFKRFVKYDEDDIIYNIPAEKAQLDLRLCKHSGHSYRRIPNHIPRATCSGRDELARDVLNDDWISTPVFISETGFISHKKTLHEEALFKCEEERYEFDLNIEANLSVISLFEPIAQKILLMPAEERATFKLPPGLGGNSSTIYKRVIKKIYDNDRGLEVIDALHQNPAVAVPIVLKRLKQKDEEWRRSQREWNKVWREIDNKNFAKALDHQGINFKLNDRKAISTKSLINEIEIMHHEQKGKPSDLANRYQFDFTFKDQSVFENVIAILLSYIESNSAIISPEEERVQGILDEFVTKLFLLDENADEKSDSNGEKSAIGTEVDPTIHGEMVEANQEPTMEVDGVEPPASSEQMLYSRLLRMKEISNELNNVRPRFEVVNQVAVDLGLRRENTSPALEKDRYTHLLQDIKDFIAGDIEANDFEDRIRELFWTSGYLIFTVDKLVQACVKQIQGIASDPKSFELISMFYRDREKKTTGPRQEALYRLCAEQTVRDDNIYRIEYFFAENVMTMQILGKEDQVTDDSITTEEKWSLYVDQFVQLSNTDTTTLNRRDPFLKRNLPTQVGEEPPVNVETRSGLELKICVNTYKIFFVDNTEDYFRRKRTTGGAKASKGTNDNSFLMKKSKKFADWLESEQGWKRGMTASEGSELLKQYETWTRGSN